MHGVSWWQPAITAATARRARRPESGLFCPENGFDRVVDDLHFLSQQLKAEHPELPLFLFGHSMGSFLTRRYLQRYCGTAAGAYSWAPGRSGITAKLGSW